MIFKPLSSEASDSICSGKIRRLCELKATVGDTVCLVADVKERRSTVQPLFVGNVDTVRAVRVNGDTKVSIFSGVKMCCFYKQKYSTRHIFYVIGKKGLQLSVSSIGCVSFNSSLKILCDIDPEQISHFFEYIC